MIQSRTLAQTALTLLEKPNAEKQIDAFLEYLRVNNLTGILPQVLAHIGRLQSKTSEDDTLHIYSKFELSDTEVNDIRSTTGATDASVEQHIDESILGGFSATYKGHIYDGSLKSQVIRLKTMLTR
ncbi:MAG: F0F1-type ATP synthase delta subunit [Candidatus Paceibacteria bacterium]|jgi:F0F1-type ATP synthase delta subunit